MTSSQQIVENIGEKVISIEMANIAQKADDNQHLPLKSPYNESFYSANYSKKSMSM